MHHPGILLSVLLLILVLSPWATQLWEAAGDFSQSSISQIMSALDSFSRLVAVEGIFAIVLFGVVLVLALKVALSV